MVAAEGIDRRWRDRTAGEGMGRWRERVGFGAVRVAMGIGGVLPRGMALVLFSAGGALFHAVEGRGRERAVRNLRSVYGANGGARRLARRVYRDLARNAVDLARLERVGGAELARLVEVSGFDRVEEAQAIWPGNASTSGISCTRPLRAAAPQTPRENGIDRHPWLP